MNNKKEKNWEMTFAEKMQEVAASLAGAGVQVEMSGDCIIIHICEGATPYRLRLFEIGHEAVFRVGSEPEPRTWRNPDIIPVDEWEGWDDEEESDDYW